jgi:hypothetical protein
MRVEITIVSPLFQEKHLAIEVPSFPRRFHPGARISNSFDAFVTP